MDKRMSDALDNHITGHYGEDQFSKNEEHLWKMGDIWHSPGQEDYILARTVSPDDTELYFFQFINIQSGNRYSDQVIQRTAGGSDCLTLSEEDVNVLLDNKFLENDKTISNELENQHNYGSSWEENYYG